MLAGMAGATDLLGTTHQMTSSYGTTVGFDSIAVALLGRTSPIGIVLAALLFGALRTGSAAMQIQAGVPAELVGVLQATILFFLVASPVIKRVFRLKGVEDRPGGRDDDHQHLRRGGDDPLMDQFLYGIPLIGLVFEFVGYLIAITADIAPIILRRRDADRVRGAVRRHVRAIGRRQHRHRGHDAGRRLRRLDGRGLPGPGPRLRPLARSSGPRRPSSRRSLLRAPGRPSSSRSSTPGCRSRCRADQIISGTIINIAAFGITGYLITLLADELADRRRASSRRATHRRSSTTCRSSAGSSTRSSHQGPITIVAARHRRRLPDRPVPDALGPAQPGRRRAPAGGRDRRHQRHPAALPERPARRRPGRARRRLPEHGGDVRRSSRR